MPLSHSSAPAPSLPPVRWLRSKEGYCDSACGRYRISPLFCGRVKPVFFTVRDNLTKDVLTRSCFTQTEAKQWVEAYRRRLSAPAKPAANLHLDGKL